MNNAVRTSYYSFTESWTRFIGSGYFAWGKLDSCGTRAGIGAHPVTG